jgi:hypothetical protein
MLSSTFLDDEGTYDPKLLNDRLLLGLKGTMSEFELGLMRQRARQAYLQKVRRGEAMWEVPVGFVRSPEGQIEKAPDRQVQQAIEMVLAKFRQLRSARQTLIWLMEERLLLPVAAPGTGGQEIRWQQATISRVHQILRNPCYAGAFAFGRTGTKTIMAEDRIRRSSSRLHRPQSQWEVLIIDHHAGYIPWSEYLENRETMAKNVARRDREGTGAIKKGSALLSGLLRCGRCGRILQIGYSGTKGQVGRYICCGRRDERGSSSCFYMGCLKIDQMVTEQLLEAIAPGGVEAALQATQLSAQADQEKRQALRLALERAQYEVQRAKRQYDAVDPENRLVASELEARWNSALKNVAELHARLRTMPEVPSITVDQKGKLMELGADLSRLWNAPETPIDLKKQILRTVIEEIVVKNGADNLEYHLQIHWAGGVHTELIVPRNKPGYHARRADDKVVELVAELAKVCDD